MARLEYIEVFVDGCRLHPGRGRNPGNPVSAAGWGAYVIEYYDRGPWKSWAPGDSIPVEQNEPQNEEWIAAIKGLQAVEKRLSHMEDSSLPHIILYSDQNKLADKVNKRIEALNKPDARLNDSLLDQLAQLVRKMHVEIKYAGHHKKSGALRKDTDEDEMAIAHDQASIAAWTQRLLSQGKVNLYRKEISLDPNSDDRESEARRLILSRMHWHSPMGRS